MPLCVNSTVVGWARGGVTYSPHLVELICITKKNVNKHEKIDMLKPAKIKYFSKIIPTPPLSTLIKYILNNDYQLFTAKMQLQPFNYKAVSQMNLQAFCLFEKNVSNRCHII
jgi:hypothetical protein